MKKMVIICGTNRNDSVSMEIVRIYKLLLEELDQMVEIIDLKALPSDFITTALYENSGKNERFNVFRKVMIEADKFVFVVPEYNGSFPGVLKAVIDGLEFPNTFTDKKCALVGLSSGVQGAGLALSHLTDIFNYCGTNVLALKPKLAQISRHLKDGEITNPIYISLLKDQAKKLVDF